MKSSSVIRFLLIGLAYLLGGTTPHAQNKPSQPADQFQIPATDGGLPGTGPIRRYDWFRKLWADRRTAWAARVERDRNAVGFDGQTSSPEGRFVARNGRLIVASPPEGRRIQQLSTTQDFSKNFILRLEFRAAPNADSGIFIRGRQLQCRDYLLAGPYKNLKNYRPGDWNEIEITVEDGTAHCLCNGEVLETAMKLPATGPVGLEGDRGQMEYRRIRIKEMP